jgi:Mu transposase-like protein
MPGKKITDHQVHRYKQHRNKLTQVAAAAKAGISERSARRIECSEVLPSQRPLRSWRTREDPLVGVWDEEVVPLLQVDAQLNAVTLLEELQRRYPGEYRAGVLRTLQRRLRQWRAVHGAEREVFFAQEHPPGRLGLSDFTVADDLGVEIDGAAFDHRLYQFALAHSGWRHAVVITEGESFLALSTGLQAALWRLGGVPEEHRTDSLSAAFNNLAEAQELTQRYENLCRHYGMRASRCNPGQSHENGSIESRHDSLKTAIDQGLRLRGSRRFDNRVGYEAFVEQIVQRFNARVAKRLAVERSMLKSLPQRRTAEYEEMPARVSKYAIFTVKGVQYSAPSQLIGHRLMVRQYVQHIECWLGGLKLTPFRGHPIVEGEGGLRWQERTRRTRRNSDNRWSSWCTRVARRWSLHASSIAPRRRSATGSLKSRLTRASRCLARKAASRVPNAKNWHGCAARTGACR